MGPRKLIPSRELEQIVGVKRETLKKYAQQGWIKPPVLAHYGPGHGRGSTLWWHPGVAFDLALIRAYQRLGYDAEKIDSLMRKEQ